MPGELQTRRRAAAPHDVVAVASGAVMTGAVDGYSGAAHWSAEGSLIDAWNALWNRKLWVLAGALLGAFGGLLAAWAQPSLYQAKALLEIQDLNDNFLDMREVAATAPGSGSQARVELQTHVNILESRTVVDAAAESLANSARQVAAAPQAGRWDRLVALARRQPPAPRDTVGDAIRIASRSLQVRSSDGSRILTIQCDSTHAGIAAGFANAVVDEFIGRGLRSRWESARQTEQWLDSRLHEARQNLEGAENSLRGYVRDQGLFFTPEQHRLEEERLGQLQQALARAQEDRVMRQSRHELAGNGRPETISEVLDDGALREYRSKLVDLHRQYAELSSLYTDQHHRVKQVLAQIQTLEPILEQERAARVSRIHNEFEAAVRREKLLADGYRQQRELVLRQADVAVDYDLLDQDVKTARQIYETLLQRAREAGIASAMAASPARIVDRATAPAEPYKPNALLSAAMGLISGGFLGVVLAFVRDQSDHRLTHPGHARNCLGLPELGVIYKSARLAGAGLYRGSKLVLRVSWHQHPAPNSIATTNTPPGMPSRIELGAWQRKHSRWAESFRATRTSILLHGGDWHTLKALAVTSPCPGDGKSTIACNLAIAMAETGRRTLLIDADLRRPRLHGIFGFSPSGGLSDLLYSDEPPGRLPLHAFLSETAIPRLSLLPSGSLDSEGPASLHSERTADLLRRLSLEFDFVVIDTPPLLPVSDGRVLARLSDAAVLVVRLGQSTREEAQAAACQLQSDGSRLLGVILNAWKPQAGAHGYYAGGYDYAPAPPATSERTFAASA